MLCQLWSATTVGIDAVRVAIETNVVHGMPKYTVVGLPDVSVRESRDRIQAAVGNSGFEFPRGAITVNLAPADLRKEGTAFDLPIAMSLLGAAGLFADNARVRQTLAVGELALDGRVRAVRGVLPMAVRALEDGVPCVLVPMANATEASLVGGIHVVGVDTLSEAFAYFAHVRGGPRVFTASSEREPAAKRDDGIDLADVRGQEGAKRALEVAAAGGHNLLMIGSPGAGKTMLARRLPTILPPLGRSEALETSKIHSVGGRLPGGSLIRERPFRAPHHTISRAGLCGGGLSLRPGEISLAHNGVLFLDELPEFRRSVLEVLRQPLEEGAITLTRALGSVVYPARFMLVASMNPCPCGYLGDQGRECVCSPSMVYRYHSKISGPLLDRIDVHIAVPPVRVEDLSSKRSSDRSSSVCRRVTGARKRQSDRLEGESGSGTSNATMSTREVRRWCKPDADAVTLVKQAVIKLRLSARAYERILRVARTIADLDPECPERIREHHMAEAIQYRSLDRTDLLVC